MTTRPECVQTREIALEREHWMGFYYNVFQRRHKSRNIKMVKVSYILHYKLKIYLCKFANLISKLNFYKLIPYPMDNC